MVDALTISVHDQLAKVKEFKQAYEIMFEKPESRAKPNPHTQRRAGQGIDSELMQLVSESIGELKMRIIDEINPGLSMLGMVVISAIFAMLGFTAFKVHKMTNKGK